MRVFLLIAFVITVLILGALEASQLRSERMGAQTFSHLAFAFRITPLLVVWGLGFALLTGLGGGVPAAIRAARARIAVALREL